MTVTRSHTAILAVDVHALFPPDGEDVAGTAQAAREHCGAARLMDY